MKKILYILLLVLVLTACGKVITSLWLTTNTGNNNTTTNQNTETTPVGEYSWEAVKDSTNIS